VDHQLITETMTEILRRSLMKITKVFNWNRQQWYKRNEVKIQNSKDVNLIVKVQWSFHSGHSAVWRPSNKHTIRTLLQTYQL